MRVETFRAFNSATLAECYFGSARSLARFLIRNNGPEGSGNWYPSIDAIDLRFCQG